MAERVVAHTLLCCRSVHVGVLDKQAAGTAVSLVALELEGNNRIASFVVLDAGVNHLLSRVCLVIFIVDGG